MRHRVSLEDPYPSPAVQHMRTCSHAHVGFIAILGLAMVKKLRLI